MFKKDGDAGVNDCFKNLNKLEFVITYACTGKCRHCSEGEHTLTGACIDARVASETVKLLAEKYNIETVMTFGGEPLLYPESVFAIHSSASKLNIARRQVITNGYFSKDTAYISEVAQKLRLSGVNDLLLSVDAFHQEFIPIDAVKLFAAELLRAGVPVKTQPAWLGGATAENEYNDKTRSILREFQNMGIAENEGNEVFPEGNALKHFGEYFKGKEVKNPYVQANDDIRCLSVEPDGTVLNGNICKSNILKIISDYNPL